MASAWTHCSDGTVSKILTCYRLARGSLLTRRWTRLNLPLPRVPCPRQRLDLTWLLALGMFGWGGAIVLALLMILFRQKRGAVIQPSSAPKANDGELLVRLELMRHYRDWMLLNDVLLPSGQGTTQIDHILVSPGGVFLIETKDMNGWVFGNPGQKQWTQSFAAGRRSRKSGIKSKQFTFYNPCLSG